MNHRYPSMSYSQLNVNIFYISLRHQTSNILNSVSVGAARVRRAAAANDVVAEDAANSETTAEVVVGNKELVEEDTTEEVSNQASRTKTVIDKATIAEKAPEQDDNVDITDTETSVEENSCDRCDFVGKTPAGLKTHKTAKHPFGKFKGFSRC